jgi:hypothetical protein
MHQHLSRVRETHPSGVESGVPECREEEAIMNVEALGVVVAFCPRDDV